MTATATATEAGITVRRPTFDLDDLPRDWIGGRWLATHFGNAAHVFIPLGERFFIDAVRALRDQVDDPTLRREIASFIGQEAVHERTHAQVWDQLKGWGLPVDAYAGFIAAVRRLEPRIPATVQLSITAALEHATAAFGHTFLTEPLGTQVPAEMEALLAWHGLEELEHRAVAFDVLQHVDDSYALRLIGAGGAITLLVLVPGVGTALFAASDLGGAVRAVREQSQRRRGLASMTARFLGTFGRHLARYAAPGFHPNDEALPAEARRVAASLDERG